MTKAPFSLTLAFQPVAARAAAIGTAGALRDHALGANPAHRLEERLSGGQKMYGCRR
jgi:hypothetical protein